MKVSNKDIAAFVANPDGGHALIYGPDSGRVFMLGEEIAKPGPECETITFDGTSVPSDPIRFRDAVMAQGLFFSRAVIRVREAGDKMTAILKSVIEAGGKANRIVIEAGELKPTSSLRKLFESTPGTGVIACYEPEPADLIRLVQDKLAKAGRKIDRDAVQWLSTALPRDTLAAVREVDKLIAFLGDSNIATFDDVRILIGDGSEAGLDEPAMAAAEGNVAEADRTTRKLIAAGQSPIGILRGAMYHFRRLGQVRSAMDEGSDMGSAIAKLRPPLFFKAQNRFKAQLPRWSMPQVERAMGRLIEAERLSKMSTTDPETVTLHAFFEIAWRPEKGKA